MPETVVADFVAASPAMREVEKQIRLVRDSAVAVLVTGEQGVGREKVARTIHASGARHREPFVHVDCAELPSEVLSPVLFGDRDEGRFELAGTGTIFLDGIDSLSVDVQERVLRVLERGTLERANGKRIVPIRARLIAATRHDLRELVDQGKFRRDLFCRLNVFPITVAPLRKRREDIGPLAQHFLALHQHERSPAVQAIEDRAIAAFKVYHWPGNLREMETVILGAILACGNDRVVRIENLPHEIASKAPEGPARTETPSPLAMDDNTIVPLSELERRAIAHALKVTGGNVTRAARALGIGRATMYRKLDRFKMAGP
ncbi:MAG: sigma 54-interacting transcriptional regulator [Planctomycetota bacterium]